MRLIKFYATDNVELTGALYKSNKNNDKIILAVHGMSSNCFKKKDEVIAKYANEAGIDYCCFNNRGSELVRYITVKKDGKENKEFGGATYEDVLDGYYDISGAIMKLIRLGYSKIYLQGHSLGCTKIIYTYNKLKKENSVLVKFIKGIILLSFVDIPSVLKVFLADRYEKYLNLAESKEKAGKETELMPLDSSLYPISVKTFLRYIRDNKEIDFININKDPSLKIINSINVPLFMRWGNVNELILEDAKIYSEKVNNIVKNDKKDIGYIDGADHSYHNKEKELAKQIIKFIKKIK